MHGHHLPVTRTTGQPTDSLPNEASMSIVQRLQWLKQWEKARANREYRQSQALEGQGSNGPRSGAVASRPMSHPKQSATLSSPIDVGSRNTATLHSTFSCPSHGTIEYNNWAPLFPTGTSQPNLQQTYRPDYPPEKRNKDPRAPTQLSPALSQQRETRTHQPPPKVIDSTSSPSCSHPDKRSRSPPRNRSPQGHPQRRRTSSSTHAGTAIRSSVCKVKKNVKVDKRGEVGDGVRRAIERIRKGGEEEK